MTRNDQFGTRRPNSKPPRPIDMKDLFMNNKTAAYAIFYNLALDNVLKIVKKEQPNLNVAKFNPREINASTCLVLKNYLWKGYTNRKNSSGELLSPVEQEIVYRMLEKLIQIRNFHSHVWHSNEILVFDNILGVFILEMYDRAKLELAETKKHDLSLLEEKELEQPFFKEHDKKQFMTVDGRNFFLSFFLYKSQMQEFLGQTQGKKNSSSPQYRGTHLVYTHFCHREGAAIGKYNQEETVLTNMTPAEQAEILKVRQASKVINYLNDIPETIFDRSFFPLYIFGKSTTGEQFFPVEVAEDYADFCFENKILAPLTVHAKVVDEIVSKGKVSIFYDEEFVFNFEMACSQFHSLLAYSLNHVNFVKQVVEKLKFFDKERLVLLQWLEADANNLPSEEDMLKYLPKTRWDEYDKGQLRASTMVKELFQEWYLAFKNNSKFEVKKREKLIDKLYNSGIELNFYDFFFMEEQKIRKENRFLHFGVEYLMQMQLVPSWEWHVERFGEKEAGMEVANEQKKNRRLTHFQNHVSQGWRLAIKDNHILVRIHFNNKNYLLNLGVNTIRTMLSFLHFKDRVEAAREKLETILTNAIVGDLEKIHNAIDAKLTVAENDLSILEYKFLPRNMNALLQKEIINGNSRAKTKKRIAELINQYELFVEKASSYTRNQRNRQIMQVYKLFEWPVKFLRENEYNHLSICHYLLIEKFEDGYDAKKKQDMEIEMNAGIRKMKFQLGEFFQQGRLPKQVYRLLDSVKTFQSLHKKALVEGIVILEKYAKKVDSISEADLYALMSILKLPLPILPDSKVPRLVEAAQKREDNYKLIPFDVHPMLVIKHCLKTESQYKSEGDLEFNLSKKIREHDIKSVGLHKHYYDVSNYHKMMFGLTEGCAKDMRYVDAIATARRRIVGWANDTMTQDVLLWQCVQHYVETLGKYKPLFQQRVNKEGVWKVSGMHKSEIDLPLTQEGKPDYVRMRFHQLDDILFATTAEKLGKAAKHLKLRTQKPKDFQFDPNNPIAFDVLIEEIELNQRHSLKLCKYIFDWEDKLLRTKTREELRALRVANEPIEYISFETSCRMANIADAVSLNKKRNSAIHMDIPEDYTIADAFDPRTALGILLGIEERLDAKRDRSIYEVNAD
jgi:hypothetical protein